jgi:hypothetical protein
MVSRLRSHVGRNLVGYIALFIALSGTAYAAKPLINGEDVQNESLTGDDVLNDSLKGADVDESTLSGVSPSGAAGGGLAGSYPNPSIASGAVGTANFSGTIPAARVAGGFPAQTIPANTHTVLTLPTEDYDTADLHSTSTNTSRLTAPVTGIYRISAVVEWSPNPNGERALRVLRNGVTQNSVNEFAPVEGQALSTEFKLAAGDRVELAVQQNSGSDALVFTQSATMSWVAPG